MNVTNRDFLAICSKATALADVSEKLENLLGEIYKLENLCRFLKFQSANEAEELILKPIDQEWEKIKKDLMNDLKEINLSLHLKYSEKLKSFSTPFWSLHELIKANATK